MAQAALDTSHGSDPGSPADRTIIKVVRGMPTTDGAGVKLTRVLGTAALPRLDPFLMLDEFRSDEPQDYLAGFPDHPHRGFETITYMIAGRFRHRDNKGHQGLLEAGGVQWMTAGKGIVHSEMPEQEEGLVHGFQLWLNLPRKDKMRDPEYLNFQPPTVSLGAGATGRVLAGSIAGVSGPIARPDTAPIYIDVSLVAGASAEIPVPPGHQAFVYPFSGSVLVGAGTGEERGAGVSTRRLDRGELGVLSDGSGVRLQAAGGARARAFVIAGRPLGEPIVQYGPFVMSTAAEIEQAVRDLQNGRF